MNPEALAVSIAMFALKDVLPELAADVEELIRGKRPDLLPDPPPSAAPSIASEDAAKIRARFP